MGKWCVAQSENPECMHAVSGLGQYRALGMLKKPFVLKI